MALAFGASPLLDFAEQFLFLFIRIRRLFQVLCFVALDGFVDTRLLEKLLIVLPQLFFTLDDEIGKEIEQKMADMVYNRSLYHRNAFCLIIQFQSFFRRHGISFCDSGYQNGICLVHQEGSHKDRAQESVFIDQRIYDMVQLCVAGKNIGFSKINGLFAAEICIFSQESLEGRCFWNRAQNRGVSPSDTRISP